MTQSTEYDALREAVNALVAEVAPAVAVPDGADDYTRGMFAAAQMFHCDLLHILREFPLASTDAKALMMSAQWRCEAHGVTTAGDCRMCDDEMIGLSCADTQTIAD